MSLSVLLSSHMSSAFSLTVTRSSSAFHIWSIELLNFFVLLPHDLVNFSTLLDCCRLMSYIKSQSFIYGEHDQVGRNIGDKIHTWDHVASENTISQTHMIFFIKRLILHLIYWPMFLTHTDCHLDTNEHRYKYTLKHIYTYIRTDAY